MNRGKIIDWITFILNVLVALPVFGLISLTFFSIFYLLAFPGANPPEWAKWFFPTVLELFLIVLWGRYQYRLLVLKVPRPPHETRLTLLFLAGFVAVMFLLFFSMVIWNKAERTDKALEKLRQIEQEKALKKERGPESSETRIPRGISPAGS